MFDEQNFGDIFGGDFVGKSGDAFADDQRGDGAAGVLRDLLRGGEGFEAGVVPLALALLGDDQNFHGLGATSNCRLRGLPQITRASNFSFSTSLAATSFGSAGQEFGFLGFRWDVDLFDFLGGSDAVTPSDSRRDRGDFFFLGGHDAF